jgi:hypothetical protein
MIAVPRHFFGVRLLRAIAAAPKQSAILGDAANPATASEMNQGGCLMVMVGTASANHSERIARL